MDAVGYRAVMYPAPAVRVALRGSGRKSIPAETGALSILQRPTGRVVQRVDKTSPTRPTEGHASGTRRFEWLKVASTGAMPRWIHPNQSLCGLPGVDGHAE